MNYKMKIKKYVDDSSLTWEERYKKLEQHHIEETKELIEALEEAENRIEALYDEIDNITLYGN